MDTVKLAPDTSGDKKLALWAANKVSVFVIFKLSGESGGSTPCVIDEFSPEVLRLKWSLEPSDTVRGELVISLQGASRIVSDIDVRALVSGSNLIDPNEAFVLVTVPSGDRYWLAMMRPSELDDA
jgi:hypothetical protein